MNGDYFRASFSSPEQTMRLFGNTFHSLIDSVDDILVYMNAKGSVLAANEAFTKLTGKPQTDIFGKPFVELFDDTDRRLFNDAYTLALKTAKPVTFQLKNNETFRRNKLLPVIDADGSILGMTLYSIDYSEYSEAERRLSVALENSKTILWEYSSASGILSTSKDYLAELGYESEGPKYSIFDLINNIVHPHDRRNCLKILNKIENRELEQFELAIRLFTKSGKVIWALSRGSLMENSAPEQYTVFSGTIVDITTQKRVEEDLQRRAALETLLSQISFIMMNLTPESAARGIERTLGILSRFLEVERGYVFSFDKQNKTMSCTDEWNFEGVTPQKHNLQQLPMEEFSWLLGELKRDSILQVYSIESLPSDADYLKELLIEQDIKSMLLLALIDGGEFTGFFGFDAVNAHKKWSENDYTLLQTFGEILINTRKRIDAEKRLIASTERLSEEVASKDKLFSIIAHDLQNPFQGLLGMSEYLENHSANMPPEKLQKISGMLSSELKNVHSLVQNLLQYSRINTGRIAFNPEAQNLYSMFRMLFKELNASAGAKELMLGMDLNAGIEVTADPFMLNTIARNLLTNAIKFSYPGSRIDVSASDDGNAVSFSVQDYGVGISEADQQKIFRADVQHTTKGTGKEKGTGLGLLVCKEFVDKHRGTIDITSAAGSGTTFTVTLPKALPSETGRDSLG